MYKKIFSIFLVLVFILSISSVIAVDTNNSDINSNFNILENTINEDTTVLNSTANLKINSSYNQTTEKYDLSATLTIDGATIIIPGGFNLKDNEGNIYLCNLLTSKEGVYKFIIPPLLHSGEYTFENTKIPGITNLKIEGSLYIIPPEDSYAALYNKIINSNGTVVLDHDYKYYAIKDSHLQNGIPIKNDVTIDGNNYTINAQNFARIFKVSANNFVLSNINLINGKALKAGAAIYTENSNIICNNVLFRNNDAFGYGGAIYNQKGQTIINENNKFINNNALFGGAIYNNFGNIIINKNNTFVNNKAYAGNGGAIADVNAKVFIGDDNTFINNKAYAGDGGAIYSNYITIGNNSCFANNNANYGGAIFSYYNLEIGSNGKFINNTASYNGGAIYSKGNITINENTFTLNNANYGYGGSLYIDNANVNINNCNFKNNCANRGGNIAIYNSNSSVKNSNFINNIALEGHTDCYTNSNVIMSNCTFDDYEYMYYNKAIHFNNSNVFLYENNLNVTIDNDNSTFESPVLLNIISIYDESEYRVFATLTADGAYVITEPFNLVDNEGNIYTFNDEYSYGLHYAFDVPEDLETGVYTFENTEIEGINDLDVKGNLTIESHYELDAHNLIKYYGSSNKLEAVVTNNGKAVSGVNVTFTINGRSYVRTTDENGVASLNINLNAGTYEANVTFGNITETVFVYIKSTIDIDDFTKTYGQYGAFEAQFCDQFGHDLVYKDIKYNINGVFYTHTTNANGEDHLNINLLPGVYIITVYNLFTGEVASATITVLESKIA